MVSRGILGHNVSIQNLYYKILGIEESTLNATTPSQCMGRAAQILYLKPYQIALPVP